MPTNLRWLLLVWLVGSAPLWAQDNEDEDNPFRPGVVATYSQEDVALTRLERNISLVWKIGPDDPRLKPGVVRAAWNGRLLTQGSGAYRLYAYGAGKVEVRLGDKVVIQAQRDSLGWLSSAELALEHDYHPLSVHYESTAADQHLRLFWSGELFSLEPLPAKHLYHEPAEKRPQLGSFERGRELAAAMRCDKCHIVPSEAASPLAVGLDRHGKQFQPGQWAAALQRLHGNVGDAKVTTSERTPRFSALDAQAAADIAAHIHQHSPDIAPLPAVKQTPGDAAQGQQLFHTIGCLACHENQQVGTAGLWSGGDLSHVSDKYASDYFRRWLTAPQELNRDHRMPLFELGADEVRDLAAYLTTLRSTQERSKELTGDPQHGAALIAEWRCNNCHHLPGDAGKKQIPPLAWPREFSDPAPLCHSADAELNKDLPRYRLTPDDAHDLRAFIAAQSTPDTKPVAPQATATQVLAQHNCLACHAREASAGLAPQLLKLAEQQNDYSSLVPALTPPSLVAVGDKLHDTVLLAMMKRMEQPHRDYLHVRMPRFHLPAEELETLLAHFVAQDRIPPQPPDVRLAPLAKLPAEKELEKTGEQLVTTAGFGCTSCHAIGGKPPVKATLNARGPNLSQIGWRTREPWFYRWCRNPVRLVPGQEMPAIQVPVKGVLNDNIDHQLAAVWTILNKPGFEPKDAGPLRVVRRSGDPAAQEQPIVGTDVLKIGSQTFIAPLVIALPNRHNVLFDLDTGRLARWWLGDTMEQRTQGKTWYWQTEAPDLLQTGFTEPEITLVRDGKELAPLHAGQFLVDVDEMQYAGEDVTIRYRQHFPELPGEKGKTLVKVGQTFAPLKDDRARGFERRLSFLELPKGSVVRWRVVSSERMKNARLDERGKVITLPEFTLRLSADSDDLRFEADGTLRIRTTDSNDKEPISLGIEYLSTTAADRLVAAPAAKRRTARGELASLPGLTATRLPLDATMMPTGFAWLGDSSLAVSSLEGRVWHVEDSDQDGYEDDAIPFPAELAAPYGIHANTQRRLASHVDVIAKDGLWRLDFHQPGKILRLKRLASGWGHTEDYHDWAVGLVAAGEDRYYAAVPAQQDNRSPAAARYRGQTLDLRFTDPLGQDESIWDAPKFTLTPLATGHRFPMGIARNKAGELFVTDNQGNYNPFNELNHVQPGKDFGFVNALDKGKLKPPLTPPAINIPHPWTRSVNGICFLETPEQVRAKLGRAAWGPFEDHLIGCEYDTRRLIRLSLQKVGETYQGACYPFSIEKPPAENFLGPICCAVSPQGELYVGSIRDSGWGAGNNTGEVVRVNYPRSLADLPLGIAEMRATPFGFTIDFTQPVDAALAADAKNYTVESFTRTSTPAYGGPDQQRRVEQLTRVVVSQDRRRVTLTLGELRTGFVYELRVKKLSSDAASLFFPAEAYYTLNAFPDEHE